MRKVGDIFILDSAIPVQCEVLEVNQEGRVTKARAVHKDERLLKIGFFVEGEDYVIFEFQISHN
jgi:hypothetical protein